MISKISTQYKNEIYKTTCRFLFNDLKIILYVTFFDLTQQANRLASKLTD